MECLENILALTRTECPCFEGISLNTNACLYLDEINGSGLLKSIYATEGCGQAFYEKVEQHIKNALKFTFTDFMASLSKGYTSPKGTVKRQQICEVRHGWDNKPSKKYAIQQVCFKGIKNAKLKIYRVGLAPFGNQIPKETVKQVKIYDECYELLDEFEITTSKTKSVWHQFDKPIEICGDESGKIKALYLVYENCGMTPKTVYNWCSCNTSNAPKWNKSISVTAYESNELIAKDCNWCSSVNTKQKGFLLDIDLECDKEKIFCCLMEDECFKLSFAQTAAAKASAFIFNDIISQKQFNYTSIYSHEDWQNSYVAQSAVYQNKMFGEFSLLDLVEEENVPCLCKKKIASLKSW